jgi:hypothetical protein
MQWLLLGRPLHLDHRLERLVLDSDRSGGAARLLGLLSGDEGDRLAEVADAVDREHRLVGELESVGLLPGHVLVRHDRVDAGHADGLGDVDREDPRVGVRAANRLPPEHPGRIEVARVRELARDLGDAVLAPHRVADAAELELTRRHAHRRTVKRTTRPGVVDALRPKYFPSVPRPIAIAVLLSLVVLGPGCGGEQAAAPAPPVDPAAALARAAKSLRDAGTFEFEAAFVETKQAAAGVPAELDAAFEQALQGGGCSSKPGWTRTGSPAGSPTPSPRTRPGRRGRSSSPRSRSVSRTRCRASATTWIRLPRTDSCARRRSALADPRRARPLKAAAPRRLP